MVMFRTDTLLGMPLLLNGEPQLSKLASPGETLNSQDTQLTRSVALVTFLYFSMQYVSLSKYKLPRIIVVVVLLL